MAATVAAARAATARAKILLAANSRKPTTSSPSAQPPAAPSATAAARSTDAAKPFLALSGFQRMATFRTLVNTKRDSKDADASTHAETSKPAVYATQKWLTNAEDAVHTRDTLNEIEGQRGAESQDKATAGVHSDSAPAAEVARRELAAHRIQYAVARYVERASLLSVARAATARAAAARRLGPRRR